MAAVRGVQGAIAQPMIRAFECDDPAFAGGQQRRLEGGFHRLETGVGKNGFPRGSEGLARRWRQASLPDVEGGIFAARNRRGLGWIVGEFQRARVGASFCPPGWAVVAPERRSGAPRRRKARLHVSQDG